MVAGNLTSGSAVVHSIGWAIQYVPAG